MASPSIFPGRGLCFSAAGPRRRPWPLLMMGLMTLALFGTPARATVVNLRGYLEGRYENFSWIRGGQVLRASAWEETVALGLSSYLWRPDFLVYSLSGNYDRRDVDATGAPDYRSNTYGYNAAFTLLPHRVYPLTLYARRIASNLDSGQLPGAQNVAENYGLQWRYYGKDLPALDVRAEQSRLLLEQQNQTNVTNIQRLDLNLTEAFNQFNFRGRYSYQGYDDQRGRQEQRHRFYLDNSIQFGPDTEAWLSSLLERQTRQWDDLAPMDSNLVSFRGNLVHHYNRRAALRARYTFSYSDLAQDGLELTNFTGHSGSTDYEYRWSRNLQTRTGVFFNTSHLGNEVLKNQSQTSDSANLGALAFVYYHYPWRYLALDLDEYLFSGYSSADPGEDGVFLSTQSRAQLSSNYLSYLYLTGSAAYFRNWNDSSLGNDSEGYTFSLYGSGRHLRRLNFYNLSTYQSLREVTDSGEDRLRSSLENRTVGTWSINPRNRLLAEFRMAHVEIPGANSDQYSASSTYLLQLSRRLSFHQGLAYADLQANGNSQTRVSVLSRLNFSYRELLVSGEYLYNDTEQNGTNLIEQRYILRVRRSFAFQFGKP